MGAKPVDHSNGSGWYIDDNGALVLLENSAKRLSVAKSTGALTVGPAGAGALTAGAATLASVNGATTVATTTVNATNVNATTVGQSAAVTTFNATTGNIATVKATTVQKTDGGALTVNADTVNAPTITATSIAKTAGGALTVTADTVSGAQLTSCTVTSRSKILELPWAIWYPGSTTPGTPSPIADLLDAYAFDADGETMYTNLIAPPDLAAGNLTLRLYWTNEAGTVIPDTKKVLWKLTLRSQAPGAVYDAGTAYTNTGLYVQTGGAGTDKAIYTTDISIVYNNADQPVAATHLLMLSVNRDVTTEAGDTYAGDATFLGALLIYPSTTL